MRSTLRRALAPLSPRRWRWRRFLASHRLDPQDLPRPVPPPGERDFILCGCPRSGTTLLAAALFQPPKVLTVMEPWDGMKLPPAELFRSLRREIADSGRLRRGKLDVQELRESGRVAWAKEGEPTPPLELAGEGLLGIKWPAFWRYLDLLPRTRFLVCVRDPFTTLNSFQQKGGRLAKGLEYDLAFNRSLNRSLLAAAPDDPALRRALLYETVHRHLLDHRDRPEVLVVRYERWFSEPRALLDEIGRFLGVELGPSPAAIRPSPRDLSLSPRERELIREHCPSAAAFGYDLS